MDELDHEKVIKKIIYKELEPSVLNEKIISKTIIDQGPDGEAGRLFRSAEIQYDKVTILRLEFLNILKIDHVWILPNLKVLSLAFNKIDKIENLEQLGRLKELNLTYNSIEKLENLEGLSSLEILSVFGNKITMIENVDCLENLIFFCAGNNLIDTKDGIERLRFLKKLRSLSLQGNSVEKSDKFFRIYIAGLLPQLTYYQNKYISKVERNEGKDRFRFKLREIMDAEKVEVEERERIAREREENIHFSECFIEQLDNDQLFTSLFVFENEEQGECLLNIGGEEKILKSEFHDQCNEITQKIFRVGLEQFEKRSAELKTFLNCVAVGKKKVQTRGQRTIDEFSRKRDEIFAKVREEIKIQKSEEKLQEKLSELSLEFNELHDEAWKILMENEMHLNESVIDLTAIFEHVIQDQMNDFMEQCKSQFVQLREVENNFVDAIVEAAQSFVTMLASSGKENDIPEQLRASLIDRDVINDLASGMREMHMQKIDGREDQLVGRGKKWVQGLCDQMMLDEVERNRRKVMEINFFLDNQQIDFDVLITDVHVKVESSDQISPEMNVNEEKADETLLIEDISKENPDEDSEELNEDIEKV